MANGASFDDLVHEAFIKPLRSVLIVDDQYPTWEEIFNSKLEGKDKSDEIETRSGSKSWRSSNTAKEVYNLVVEFRRQNPGFIIDIHDGISFQIDNATAGSETPQELADHLHQSDLLILDYNLEGSEAGTGGETARKILSSVLSNQHFNLVVIHTSEDLNDVVHECLCSLMKTCTSQYASKVADDVRELENTIADKEDEGDFNRNLINEKIDLASYVCARDAYGVLTSALSEFMQGIGAFSELSSWADELSLEGKQKRTFFYWAVRELEEKKIGYFTENPPDGLLWNISDNRRWLRTSRGFVCFVKKGPKNLITELKDALGNWKPTPSRLLSAKYRDEISRMGADVEDQSLRQKHAFAKFYDTILNPGANGLDLTNDQVELLRSQKLRDHVSRQSEMLSFLIEEAVIEFGSRIYEADRLSEFQFKHHYDVDLTDQTQKREAVSQFNRHICCLPSKTAATAEIKEQLDSGHVFKTGDDWWVCATPACDLQPGQNTIAFSKGSDQSLKPFTALKLEKVSDLKDLTSDHINSGSYCYIEYEGEVVGLGTRSPKKDTEKPAEPKVFWRSMVAKNGGVISNGKLELLEVRLELENNVLKSELKVAEVVAKLRYEYALNFIQRVGGSVSRIGLGYVS